MEEVQLDSSDSARTQEHILNYLISQIGYKGQTRKVLLDALLFPYGVMWHGYKGNFGMTEEQSIIIQDERIFVSRIGPLRFIHDPSVSISNLSEGKWVGRVIDIPMIDFLEDNKLDIDKAMIKGRLGFGDKIGKKEALLDPNFRQTGGADIQLLNKLRKSMIDFADEDFKNSRAARFVRLFELYLRPTKKERREGSKGKILLLTDEQPKPLRENEWVIKAEGFPSQILQFNELNDHIFGLTDIETYRSIADQKNAIINLQLRNAQENTKVWVGISKENIDGEEDITKIQKGENTIVLFNSGNPRDRMFVASPGGAASSELYLIDGRIQKNLEDKSGVTDLKRGFLQSGEESAASVKLRAAGGSARPAYRQDIMADFLKASFLYLNQLNKQFMTIKDAVRIVGSLDLEWSENPTKEELQADVDVEIDAISMLPENPEKEVREVNTVLALAIQALTTPAIKAKLQEEGKIINLSPLIERILLRLKINDSEVFRNVRPEESQGFVSVQQLKEAQANVQSVIKGGQIQFPPKPEDDHRAKLEVYTAMLQVIGQNQILKQLIQIHQILLQQIQQKQARPGQTINLKKPTLQTL